MPVGVLGRGDQPRLGIDPWGGTFSWKGRSMTKTKILLLTPLVALLAGASGTGCGTTAASSGTGGHGDTSNAGGSSGTGGGVGSEGGSNGSGGDVGSPGGSDGGGTSGDAGGTAGGVGGGSALTSHRITIIGSGS